MNSKRAPVAVLWVVVAVAAAVLTAQAFPSQQSNAQAGFGAVLPVAPPVPAPEPRTFAPFAFAADVTVHLPMEKPVGVMFHEASSREAIPMAPYGRLRRSANPRFQAPRSPAPGTPYSVMASRGRGTASTSAVDIVAPAGATLYSPVTGTVRVVKAYWLYGKFADIRVEIEPENAPGVRIVMIHLERVVHVAVGQRVVVSKTPIGRARVLPFNSQTDEYTHTHDPHVHLEIKRVA